MITAAGRARPATVVPAWFLLPGLGALLASVVAYVQYQRYVPAVGLDLDIYREAVRAFRAGRPVYDLTFALGLPYTYPPVTLSLLMPLATLEAAEALPVMTALSIAAVFLTVWCVTGLTGYRGIAGRTGTTGGRPGSGLTFSTCGSGTGGPGRSGSGSCSRRWACCAPRRSGS